MRPLQFLGSLYLNDTHKIHTLGPPHIAQHHAYAHVQKLHMLLGYCPGTGAYKELATGALLYMYALFNQQLPIYSRIMASGTGPPICIHLNMTSPAVSKNQNKVGHTETPVLLF